MRIMIIGAHPDDEVLGCGGTAARFVSEGHEVSVVILGEGITARYDKRYQANHSLLEELHFSMRKAASILGLPEPTRFDLPDNRFDTVPLLDIIKKIEQVIAEIGPDTVFTHHNGDLNIDHTITFRAVMTALRPLPACPVKALYTFEAPSSTEWAFGRFASAFQPDFFVDISRTLDVKFKAIEAYTSELCPFPHPRSKRVLRSQAERWGSVIGLPAAEAFETIFRRI